jgi:Lrp/AsnC family transcriptional regulator, regulator for asnA, asnC and gidA
MTSMAEHSEAAGRHTHLDDVSKAIIEQLQQDGRRAYAKIGQAVGLS